MLFEHLYDGVHRAPLLLDARCMWMELVVEDGQDCPETFLIKEGIVK